MNWIKNFVRPRIRSILGQEKREVPENMWIKDPDSGQMVFYKDLEANLFVFPGSNHHHRMPAEGRFTMMFDGAEFEKLVAPIAVADPLKFRAEKRYVDQLKDAKAKAAAEDSVQAGYGEVNEQPMVVAVQDMGFIGGSLGMAAGDAIIAAMRYAVTKHCPFVMFVASGGARMQEGILSLMQLPRTTIAVQELRAAKLPYIVVLTNPTTGGVTASYAMLGDVHLAEPNAQIGFAGQRVIEQTIREKLPPGFQRSEYLKDHGMVDMVVHRHEMKSTVSRIARLLMKQDARVETTALVPAE
ncbi:acetyl-CoA carboxylase, carboxyltransferase subunit beta [Aestuariivirga litoralis]|uniref:acetyl-CoA carboxylase, carboxyltransferase subunit beta n=1 Tax=Aestuariivirga litoralis TaxID=2650924 RepID=UPI0018C631F7|nr:acetyl-CoA carboxylase, carboxyltransferase subunit beta [Aestuariivirga litoralis]MBG1233937.1 acetyl-CoA carboxylase carboxyltransferase subunit beta [Aestuariivirga litoralis]